MEQYLSTQQVYRAMREFVEYYRIKFPFYAGLDSILSKYLPPEGEMAGKHRILRNWETTIGETSTFTSLQAYQAMINYLDFCYGESGKPDLLGTFLGSMNLRKDQISADPAFWDDWLKIVNQIL